ncbi:hypothetical protein SNEBB_007319 [Seison nebaliae]|nr:hypothetical protein SNEBB_007319 [Seison nebaliae]
MSRREVVQYLTNNRSMIDLFRGLEILRRSLRSSHKAIQELSADNTFDHDTIERLLKISTKIYKCRTKYEIFTDAILEMNGNSNIEITRCITHDLNNINLNFTQDMDQIKKELLFRSTNFEKLNVSYPLIESGTDDRANPYTEFDKECSGHKRNKNDMEKKMNEINKNFEKIEDFGKIDNFAPTENFEQNENFGKNNIFMKNEQYDQNDFFPQNEDFAQNENFEKYEHLRNDENYEKNERFEKIDNFDGNEPNPEKSEMVPKSSPSTDEVYKRTVDEIVKKFRESFSYDSYLCPSFAEYADRFRTNSSKDEDTKSFYRQHEKMNDEEKKGREEFGKEEAGHLNVSFVD